MSLPNYMGCLMEFCKSLTLFYTKMCFKILYFFVRTSVFLMSNLLYNAVHVLFYFLFCLDLFWAIFVLFELLILGL
jgi:hypothetical protein